MKAEEKQALIDIHRREPHGNKLIAIDPGNKTGVAIFSLWHTRLLWAGTCRPEQGHKFIDLAEDACIYAEIPKIYPTGRSPASPNAIIKTALHLGLFVGPLIVKAKEINYLEPAKWKGQVPKAIHQSKIAEALDPKERDIWDLMGPDARDAIGIGLFALKRTGKSGGKYGNR